MGMTNTQFTTAQPSRGWERNAMRRDILRELQLYWEYFISKAEW